MDHLLSFFLLILISSVYVSASVLIIKTGIPSQPRLGISIYDVSQIDGVNTLISRHILSTLPGLALFAQDIARSYPDIDLFTDEAVLDFCSSRVYGSQLVQAESFRSTYNEERVISCIEDWLQSSSYVAADQLSVVLVDRENILEEGVRAFKSFDRIPFTAPYHLFLRNLKIEFEGTYQQESNSPFYYRAVFFELFFKAASSSNRYFMRNPQGFLIFAENDNLTEQDMDFYEAFGFYLAKAIQNLLNSEFKLKLLPQIVQVIKTGKLSRKFPLKWRSQALMLALGFVRACPTFIVDKYPIDTLALAL